MGVISALAGTPARQPSSGGAALLSTPSDFDVRSGPALANITIVQSGWGESAKQSAADLQNEFSVNWRVK